MQCGFNLLPSGACALKTYVSLTLIKFGITQDKTASVECNICKISIGGAKWKSLKVQGAKVKCVQLESHDSQLWRMLTVLLLRVALSIPPNQEHHVEGQVLGCILDFTCSGRGYITCINIGPWISRPQLVPNLKTKINMLSIG